MIIKNIKWMIDTAEICKKLENTGYKTAAGILGISPDACKNMSDSERADRIYFLFGGTQSHCLPDEIYSLFELPTMIEAPDDVYDPWEYLKNEYGYDAIWLVVNSCNPISDKPER